MSMNTFLTKLLTIPIELPIQIQINIQYLTGKLCHL